MAADELAFALVGKYIKDGDSVLDPFCGSGRLLAAASVKPGIHVGIDTNPLACLLTRAKLTKADPAILEIMLEKIDSARARRNKRVLKLRDKREVEWFSPAAVLELSQIVYWINDLQLEEPERIMAAVALSGAARDASFARKNAWKLHRMSASSRARFDVSAWDSFARRLRYCIDEISNAPSILGDVYVELGDARQLATPSPTDAWARHFDVILTSPPYGDSRTTVQYGAASALCLQFVSRIEGFEDWFVPGSIVDARCLGGKPQTGKAHTNDLRPFWAGSKDSRRAPAVSAFLTDFAQVCTGIAARLKPKGIAILIVGNRTTGSYRVKLDEFTVDQFQKEGLCLVSTNQRRLREKRLPRMVNRYGRCESRQRRAEGWTRTMTSEMILAFQKSD